MNNIKIKINEIIQKILAVVKPKLVTIDTKINVLIPNPKMKRVLYITVGSLFGFMFLIIVLGLLLSPFKNKTTDSETKINKPNIQNSSPEPQKELSEIQKQIMKLENDINNLTFPESTLNIPIIERGLSI